MKKVEATISKTGGSRFVKNIYRVFYDGATIENIELMREAVVPIIGSQGIWWNTYDLRRLKPLSKLKTRIVLRQSAITIRARKS